MVPLVFLTDSPFNSILCALWITRSQIASAMVGTPRVSCHLEIGRYSPSRRERDQRAASLVLALLDVAVNGLEIITELLGICLASGPHLFDDRVLPHYVHSPMSSSGVQITGGS